MTVPERRRRSALARLVSQRGLLRGNLLQRRRVCGKPNCKCTRGELHVSTVLADRSGQRLRNLTLAGKPLALWPWARGPGTEGSGPAPFLLKSSFVVFCNTFCTCPVPARYRAQRLCYKVRY